MRKQSLLRRFWKRIYSKTGYLYSTRTPAYGVLLALPLLAGYEYLAYRLNGEGRLAVRNLADVYLREIIERFGADSLLYLGALLVLAVLLPLFLREKQTAPIRISYYFLAILEATFYATFMGILVTGIITALFGSLTLSQEQQILIMLSLGAGVYEELIFRVFLFKLTAFMLERLFSAGAVTALVLAALFSSVLFSLSHFLGSEAPAFYPFIYRFIMGLFFCAIFWARGLGIVAWAHALYNLFVLFNNYL